jgi:3-dehydroquinate dehydratase
MSRIAASFFGSRPVQDILGRNSAKGQESVPHM